MVLFDALQHSLAEPPYFIVLACVLHPCCVRVIGSTHCNIFTPLACCFSISILKAVLASLKLVTGWQSVTFKGVHQLLPGLERTSCGIGREFVWGWLLTSNLFSFIVVLTDGLASFIALALISNSCLSPTELMLQELFQHLFLFKNLTTRLLGWSLGDVSLDQSCDQLLWLQYCFHPF